MVLAIGFCILTAGAAVTVTVDPSTKYQTIDGFGGFGGLHPFWEGPTFYDEKWLSTVIDSIGITLNRCEFHPLPEKAIDWNSQVPLLKALEIGRAHV